MFHKQCFATWANGKTFCLTNKSQMFDERFSVVWQKPTFQILYQMLLFVGKGEMVHLAPFARISVVG